MRNKCLIALKRIFRYEKIYEVWDSSAMSTGINYFKERLQQDNINIIVPEGVRAALFDGRRNHQVCREACEIIRKSPKVKVHLNTDEMKAWSLIDQVVAVQSYYHNKGYNVYLITCSLKMADAAKERGLSVKLLDGNKGMPKGENNYSAKKLRVEGDEVLLPCSESGQLVTINASLGVAVYGAKGRKVGKNGKIPVEKGDTFEYQGESYQLKKISECTIYLKRIDST